MIDEIYRKGITVIQLDAQMRLNTFWIRKGTESKVMKYESAGPLVWIRQRQPNLLRHEGLCAGWADPRLGSRSYFATVDCTLGNRRMSSVDVHHSLQIYKKPRAWERGPGNLEPNHTYVGSVTISATVFHRKEVPKVILRSSSQGVRDTY